MAYALKYIRLIPMAIRVSLAGGAAYGSVKVGVWSPNTAESKEKLDMLQREIEYPHGGKTLLGDQGPLGPRLVRGWNDAVRSAFLVLGGEGGLQSETLSSLKVGLKRWGAEIKKSISGSEKSR